MLLGGVEKTSTSREEEVFYLETTKTTGGLFCAKVNFKNYVTMCTHTSVSLIK